MRLVFFLAAFFLLFRGEGALAQSLELKPLLDGSFSTQDILVTFSHEQATDESTTIAWEEVDLEDIHTSYLRVLLGSFSVTGEKFEIVFSGSERSDHFVVSSDELKGRSRYWSPLISGNYARIEVMSATSVDGSFKIEGVAYQTETVVPLSITDEDCRQHVGDFLNGTVTWTPGPEECLNQLPEFHGGPALWKGQRAVAKLSFMVESKPHVCTGFLVSENLLVTNHHCVPDNVTCETSVAIFGYQYEKTDNPQAPWASSEGDQFQCGRVVKSNYYLDYALLEIKGLPGGKYGFLAWAAKGARDGDGLYIVQHPAGQRKQVSLIGCSVIKDVQEGRTKTSDLTHSCDTLGGSSGSPVLNYKGEVIGLHHYGFGDDVAFWNQNRAVRAELVRTHMALD